MNLKKIWKMIFTKNKKKLNRTDQIKMLNLLTTMMKNGFSIYDSAQLLQNAHNRKDHQFGKVLENSLQKGLGVNFAFEQLGFPPKIVLQILFAENNGNLLKSLVAIKAHLEKVEEEREKLIKVLSYPTVLLIFLVVILLIMRNVLVPELKSRLGFKNNFGIVLLNYGPMVIVAIFLVGIFSVLLLQHSFSHKSGIEKANFLAKLPFWGQFYALQLTSYLSRELGSFLNSGMELKDVLNNFKKLPPDDFLKDLSCYLEQGLQRGLSLDWQFNQLTFVLDELSAMINCAEIDSNLGEQLIIYGDSLSQRLLFKIERRMRLIQPLVFIFVGGMIILVYVSMLLPVYDSIGEGIE